MSKWRAYYWKIYLAAEELRTSCVNCGSSKNVEFAHLKPTKLSGRGRGSHHRRLDVLHNLDKYTRLCKRCHGAFDNGRRAQVRVIPLSWLVFCERMKTARV